MARPLTRRAVLRGAALGLAGLAADRVGLGRLCASPFRPPFPGPRVVLIRFGGGVRREETIGPIRSCWAPFFRNELLPRGTLYPRMEIARLDGLETSHGQGTLNILTGRYDRYVDVDGRLFGQRFEAKVPTVFEYLRAAFDVPEHQALIVNGEDRPDEEFFAASVHRDFGVAHRARTLSRYWLRRHALGRRLEEAALPEPQRRQLAREKAEMEARDGSGRAPGPEPPELTAFWERWRARHGDDGRGEPRGDRLLTELAACALRELRPRLLLVNYQDPDYVHWGNANHYTWGVRIIDDGLRRLVATVEADEELREDTIFVVVPDCGRDANPLLPVPFQHHFNSRSAHEIFAFLCGPGVASGRVVDRTVDQTAVAGTIGRLAGFATPHAESEILHEALA